MTTRVCSQPNCPFSVSGKCLEGFNPIESCPYQSELEMHGDEATVFLEQNDSVVLPAGEALTEEQAAEVTKEDRTKVIVIAGPYDSGKTTILTSLFEAFQEAPFSNFLFRGSRTLFGFERRCHLGRVESGSDEADTTHTSLREGVKFLHLSLAAIEASVLSHFNLLLSDISGELFNRLRDSKSATEEFVVSGRADHICIVIDGEKLCSLEERNLARTDSRSILRSFVEAGGLSKYCVIDVVFSKWDLVVEALASEGGKVLQTYIDATRALLLEASRPFEVRFHEVAARPAKNARVPFAHGLPTLLRSWTVASGEKISRRHPLYLSDTGTREFQRFTSAVIQRNGLQEEFDVRPI